MARKWLLGDRRPVRTRLRGRSAVRVLWSPPRSLPTQRFSSTDAEKTAFSGYPEIALSLRLRRESATSRLFEVRFRRLKVVSALARGTKGETRSH